MKNTLYILALLAANMVSAQIAIGKNSINSGAILEFDSNSNKTIILPKAEISSSNTYTNGTILMDKTDLTIKVRQNNAWLKLSDEGSFVQQVDGNNTPTTTAYTPNTSDEVGKGVIIGEINVNGEAASGADGVLVLEARDKALVLPHIANPHTTIKSPVAGTMCYDTVSNSLAVFDGKVWNYWK